MSADARWTTKTARRRPEPPDRDVTHTTTRHGMEIAVERKSYGSDWITVGARLAGRKLSVFDSVLSWPRPTDADLRARAIALADDLLAAGFRGLTDEPATAAELALIAEASGEPGDREVVAGWTRGVKS